MPALGAVVEDPGTVEVVLVLVVVLEVEVVLEVVLVRSEVQPANSMMRDIVHDARVR